jgi:hypothetical protein
MPWAPELFTAPALQHMSDQRRRDRFITVPFFDGLMVGEMDALVGSFAGVPELHHPVRGRIRGRGAFEAYARELHAWMTEHNVSVDDVQHIVSEGHGCGEAVLHFDRGSGRTSIPVAIVSDRQPDGRIDELRMYFTARACGGRRRRDRRCVRTGRVRP